MVDKRMKVTDKYLTTMLTYYEEEIMGEAYFYGLMNYFNESEKLELLARIERHTANLMVPLLQQYNLKPRDEHILKALGETYIERHQSYSWTEFMTYMVHSYPEYLDAFIVLEEMAPKHDLNVLKLLSAHEVILIDFAQSELEHDPDSLRPVLEYLEYRV